MKTPTRLDPSDEPPIDRYADLILKGGVTDGVIYPWAIMALAQQYRFKNIGGTSVGALAAALTAAAEYNRRHGSVVGFNEVMLKIPSQLAAHQADGNTKLYSLFQASNPAGKRLLELFVALFSFPQSSVLSKTLCSVLKTVFTNYKHWIFKGLAIGVALAAVTGFIIAIFPSPAGGHLVSFLLAILGFFLLFFSGLKLKQLRKNILDWFQYNIFLSVVIAACWLAYTNALTSSMLPAEFGIAHLIFALGIIFFSVLDSLARQLWCDVQHGLIPDGFGLCSGKQLDPDGTEALIDWLHQGIQAAAGRPLNRPLTFKDLWDAPCGPGASATPANNIGLSYRSINLQMVSSNLSYRRPYGLPLEGNTNRLFFLSQELSNFFPDAVMAHLLLHAKPHVTAGQTFYELPQGEMPIIVATRLSLSFPILFKAVPLWGLKTGAAGGVATFERCWFSDGGICSNFPVHQFDAAIPRWPTFGIMLSDTAGPNGAAVWVSDTHMGGLEENKNAASTPSASPLASLGEFIKDIVYTAKDWNDNNSVRLPGVRDRVVHVKLPDGASAGQGSNKNLGGLNLKLSSTEIMSMASEYGLKAGQLLVAKFLDPRTAPGTAPRSLTASPAWSEHRWVRFNSFVTAMRARMIGFSFAAESADYSEKLSRQITRAGDTSPLSDDPTIFALTDRQEQALKQAQSALNELESSLAAANAVQAYQPNPTVEILLRSPL